MPLLGAGIERWVPKNVFAYDPPSSWYYAWWRPVKVVFDLKKAAEIKKQIDSLSVEDAESADFEEVFKENRRSSFLFPLLAAEGQKGAIILGRLLEPYRGKDEVDRQWLVIVASLGRIATPESQRILEDHLKWMMQTDWKEVKMVKIKGREIDVPVRDPRIAVLDSLLACLAGRGSLTATKIDALYGRAKECGLGWKLWMCGLEWSRQLMSEQKLLETIEDALKLCDKQELFDAMDINLSSDRASAISKFLRHEESRAMTKKMLLDSTEYSNVVFDFLLLQYMWNLFDKAEAGKGKYAIDEKVVDIVTRRRVGNHGKLSFTSKILLGCQTRTENRKWEQFLSNHAEKLEAKHEPVADSQIKRIHGVEGYGPKRPTGKDNERRAPREITKPGVYMPDLQNM